MKTMKLVFLIAVTAFLGFQLGNAIQKPAVKPIKPESPLYRSLDANLFLQTSAEYQACCYQAFALAKERLKNAKSTTGKPLAVILDLDETVLDNSVFQSSLVSIHSTYDDPLWDSWERNNAANVTLVPGAKEFLDFAKEQKIAIVYISNRKDSNREGTKAVLANLNISVPDDQLLLNKSAKSSDKTERREEAAKKFEIVLLVGDNLRDFDEKFKFDEKKDISKRREVVTKSQDRFGKDWIILPNPIYGEWAKPFAQKETDKQFLKPSIDFKP